MQLCCEDDSPADGVEQVSAQLSYCWQGKGCQPLQVVGEGGEEDKVEEEEVDDHVAGHVQLGGNQPLELTRKGRLLPPGRGEEEADGDADGEEAGGDREHRDHGDRARKVQKENPDHPL